MTILELDLSFLFVIAVVLIWFMIAYQFLLTLFGYVNFLRSLREKREVDSTSFNYPTCSVLIPAHNEETVIGRTLEAMLALEYPSDKLSIIVINDGSSDATRDIVMSYVKRDDRVTLFDIPKGQGGKGKSRALNLGLREVTSDVVAIYDADNTPRPNALKYLVAQLLLHREVGAVLGKFRTANKDVNLLTRFINIETLSFQSMLQAGRWQLHNIATLPGTNFIIRTQLIKTMGGWDEEALTEDSELSIRIYQHGYKIKFVPYSVTYEQEPQEWRVFIKQRMRWVRGNSYVLAKFVRQLPRFKNKRLAFDLLYTMSLYYVFFIAILISDIIFILGIVDAVHISLPGPYTIVWVMAFLLFVLEIVLAISYDGEDRMRNVGLIVLMYFTYCQLWMYIVMKAMYAEYVAKEKHIWDKTVRFRLQPEEGSR